MRTPPSTSWCPTDPDRPFRPPPTLTDAEGKFRLKQMDPNDTLPLRAYTEDAVTHGAVVITPGGGERVRLVATPENAFRLKGRVVDGKGRPVARAAIGILWYRRYVSSRTTMAATGSQYFTLETDAEGVFRTPALFDGDRYSAVVKAIGIRQVPVAFRPSARPAR